MTTEFFKYQGTGNDFVIIDNRQDIFGKNNANLIAKLCDRRFGIGADGLILLEDHPGLDFKMVYFNSDGHPSSMCGNGGRCITAFAKYLGIIDDKAKFEAIDGEHQASIYGDMVKLEMQPVSHVETFEGHAFLDTGSPHHVQLETDLQHLDVKSKGHTIRYGAPYHEAGTNVNFVEQVGDNTFAVRTYERGVEDETLSCGTGVTAVALAMHHMKKTDQNTVKLSTPGGTLEVMFESEKEGYHSIWLIGKATQVFKGEVTW
ncbi:MAG: diaminopimelate epimerase [Bacteroidota bacterium]